jgi:hypothetical protein
MAGSTPVFAFPYPQASDLVANYPALGQDLAEDVETVILGRGKIRQVLSTTKTDTFSTTSTSMVDITGMTLTITPSATTSKILVSTQLYFGASGGIDITAQLLRGATVIGSGAGGTNNGSFVAQVPSNTLLVTASNSFLDSPSTTSATTYKIQMKVNSGTGYLGRRGTDTFYVISSTITVMEVLA